MAVLPASQAYPRGGAPRRTYTPGAPLFAKMAMKFLGVEYKRGDVLPVESMSKHKHWELWTCGKADHSPFGPFDKVKPAVVEQAAGNASDQVDAEGSEPAAAESAEPTQAEAVETHDVTPGETVEVETPKQKRSRRAAQE